MRTVTLSGWGQPHDALASIIPGSTAIDYAHTANAEEALRMIGSLAQYAERIIGWSLGGQLAVRAVARGVVAPKQLVLLATPYQFVDDGAMGRETFDKFHANYTANPKRTLDKAWELIHYEDAQAPYIRNQMATLDKDAVLKKDWLRWLNLLDGFSCDKLDFKNFPPTLLVHGMKDKVVAAAQSQRMASRIKHAKLELWKECGHAPHLHDIKRLRQMVESHV
jgi:pimeloyl-[acyl-carrier protein] methyl ester esterase